MKNKLYYGDNLVWLRDHEYFPTESCRELLPIILSIGEWGMRWAISNLTENDYDVELLMLYLQRSVVPEKLPGNESVIRFRFTDIKACPDWWMLVEGDSVDLCTNDPGKDVDVYFTSSIKTFVDVWMGKSSYRKAIRDGEMTIVGNQALTGNVSAWMNNSTFKDLPAASEI